MAERDRGRAREDLGVEWVGGRFRMPAYVMEGEPYRPELVLWLELPSGLLVAHGVSGEKSGEQQGDDDEGALARALKDALARPTPGAARRPARLRVADHGMAAELRNAFAQRFAIGVAPTPELDALFEQFVESMPSGEEKASYLEDGRVSERTVSRMFRAAALLYRAAPWRVASDDEVLRMDIPALGVEGACVSIIGALGESLGLIVFPSLLGYERFGAAAEQASSAKSASRRRALDLGGSVLSLDFWRAREVPGGMRREVAKHGWPTVSPDAFPVVGHRDRDGQPRPLAEKDVRIATECAFALASFFARHPGAFGGRLLEPVSESSTMDDSGVTVRLTAPYEAAAEFEALAPQSAAPAKTFTGSSGKIGRNEACPCGSGKKYKKCCLARDEGARSQQRKGSSVHEIDERVVWQLRGYAAERYGAKWKAETDRFARAAGASEPLLVQLAAPWSVYVARIEGQRPVDAFLEEEGGILSPEERAWLAAQQRAPLSVWEITACEPGVAVTVRDLLSGEGRRVNEVSGSRALVARDAVLARVVDYEGVSYFCGMYPRMLPPHAAARVVASIRKRAGSRPPRPEGLRDDDLGLAMIRAWAKAVREEEAVAAVPKKLVNTDGEALVMTTDHFDFDGMVRKEVRSKLIGIDGVEPEEEGEACTDFTVFKKGNAVHAHWDNTVLAHLTLGADRLRVETNSVERADCLRAQFEAGCAGLLRHRVREHVDPLSSARSDGADRGPPPEPPPEALQALREFKAQHYAHWADTPLPALSGKTPRQAARTKGGRERVDVLLRSMENSEHRAGGGAPFDFGPLRRGLGIDADDGSLTSSRPRSTPRTAPTRS